MITEPATAGRPPRLGRQLYDGHASWAMSIAIKLGIAYTVSRASSDPIRELSAADFDVEYKRKFPPAGSRLTPKHTGEEFTFKDYAPDAFRQIREHFGVSAADYILSIAGEHPLRELGNPGKSGSCFYLTHDSKYIIKTVSKKECKFLRAALPMYYTFCVANDSTMLPRFFGLVRINLARGDKQRLILMNNLLPERYRFERYDLKGSSLGRAATTKERNDPLGVRKDRDFEQKLRLPEDMLSMLTEQLQRDSAWLEKLHVMDYSLLVGLNWPNRNAESELRSCCDLDPSGADTDDEPWEESRTISASQMAAHRAEAGHAERSSGTAGGIYQAEGPGAYEPDAELWRRQRPWNEVDGSQLLAFGGTGSQERGPRREQAVREEPGAEELSPGSNDEDESDTEQQQQRGAAAGSGARARLGEGSRSGSASCSNLQSQSQPATNTRGARPGGGSSYLNAFSLGSSVPAIGTQHSAGNLDSGGAGRLTNSFNRHASSAYNSDSDDDEPSAGAGVQMPSLFRSPSNGMAHSASLPSSDSTSRLAMLVGGITGGMTGPASKLAEGVKPSESRLPQFKGPALPRMPMGMGGKAAPVEVPQPTEAELRAAFVLCHATLAKRALAIRRYKGAHAEGGEGSGRGSSASGGRGVSKDVSAFKSDDGGFRCVNGKGESVRVYCGIIDILQQYTKFKQMEHAYKVARWYSEKEGISVVSPDKYALRFRNFILGKFAPLTTAPGSSAIGAGAVAAAAIALSRAALGEDGVPHLTLQRRGTNSGQESAWAIAQAEALAALKTQQSSAPKPQQPQQQPVGFTVEGRPAERTQSEVTIVRRQGDGHSSGSDDEGGAGKLSKRSSRSFSEHEVAVIERAAASRMLDLRGKAAIKWVQNYPTP